MKKLFVFCLTLLSFMVSKAQDITGVPAVPGQENWYIFQCRNDASIKSHAWVIAPGAGSFINEDGTLSNCSSKLMGGDCSAVKVRWNTDCDISQVAHLAVYTTTIFNPAVACNAQGLNPFESGVSKNQYSGSFGEINNPPCTVPGCSVLQSEVDNGRSALSSSIRTLEENQLLFKLVGDGGIPFFVIEGGFADNSAIAGAICANLSALNSGGNCNLNIGSFCNFPCGDITTHVQNIISSNGTLLQKAESLIALSQSEQYRDCSITFNIVRGISTPLNTNSNCPDVTQLEVNQGVDILSRDPNTRSNADNQLLYKLAGSGGNGGLPLAQIIPNTVNSAPNKVISGSICANLELTTNNCSLDTSGFCEISCSDVDSDIDTILNNENISFLEKAIQLDNIKLNTNSCGFPLSITFIVN